MPRRYDCQLGRGQKGANRVIRGGAWNNNARNVRAAYRNYRHPSNRNDNLGFRLALAQTRAAVPATDQAAVQSAYPCYVGSKHGDGRRCVSRAAAAAAKAHRRLILDPQFHG